MVQNFPTNNRVLSRFIPGLCAIVAVALGIVYGTFTAADTDPYGYVSQAELFASGTLRVDQRFALSLPWRDAEGSFIPGGYKRATIPGFIVPVYSPGLPMTMAVFLRATGSRDAVYYVVPLLGGLLILAAARLGEQLFGDWGAALSAVLVVSSPTFVSQVTQPVSDIPAAAWWSLAIALAVCEGRVAALGAGLSAAMAILARPNLVPVAAVIGIVYLTRSVRAEPSSRRDQVSALLLFVAGTLPGCIAVAALNTYWYGSPLQSGYAPFNELYAWDNVLPNLDRYPRWLLQTQSPFIYLAFLAPWILRGQHHVTFLLTVAVVVILSYVPYGVFEREQWGYLRFLLPAYPMLLVLSLVVSARILERVVRQPRLAARALIAGIAVLCLWQTREAVTRGVFVLREIERRYVDVGRYVASMPADTVFISSLHSGSIRYYADRLTMNFTGIHPHVLEEAVTTLTTMGRRVYFVIEEGEEAHFKWMFGRYSGLGRLDWPPAVKTSRGASVRIYDPADRGRFFAGQAVLTYDLHDVAKPPTVTQR